jgi:alkylhydroperoxidase family enzyme
MLMARVPYFDRSKLEGRAKAAMDKLPPLNLFAMLAHSGDLVDGVTKLGNQLLSHTELDPWLREIVILRVGVITGSAYEVYQHRRIAQAYRIADERIDAVIAGDMAALMPLEQAVCAMVETVLALGRPSDEQFNQMMELIGLRPLQELVLTCGYYFMISRFLVTFDVDIESQEQMGGDRPPLILPGMDKAL